MLLPVDVGLWCGALLVSDAADFLWFLVPPPPLWMCGWVMVPPPCGCGAVVGLCLFLMLLPVDVGLWCGALLVSDAADFLWFLVLLPPHSVRRCSFICGFGFYSRPHLYGSGTAVSGVFWLICSVSGRDWSCLVCYDVLGYGSSVSEWFHGSERLVDRI